MISPGQNSASFGMKADIQPISFVLDKNVNWPEKFSVGSIFACIKKSDFKVKLY